MAYFFWDPDRSIFSFPLPLLGRPILWYGFFFALGFFLGYFILLTLLKKIFNTREEAKVVAEKITCYVAVGALVGARLGDLLFYQKWSDSLRDPFLLFKVWEGGLASHGGALGILVAVFLLARQLKPLFPKLTMISLLDLIVIPTGLVAACIRVGNFFNQEILGTPTSVRWAVIFGHPADGSLPIPRHPAQLYEALFYLMVGSLTFTLWSKAAKMQERGKMVGLFLMMVFSFRFLIEFLKEEQSLFFIERSVWLDMGQLLSLPFILLGIYLFFSTNRSNKGLIFS